MDALISPKGTNMDVAGASIPESGIDPQLPPPPVRLALRLYACNTVVYKILLPAGMLAWAASRESAGATFVRALWPFILFVPATLVNALIYFNLRKRRNWARGLLVVTIAFGLFIQYRVGGGNGMELNWWFLIGLYYPLNVAVAVLLFSPIANHWLRGR